MEDQVLQQYKNFAKESVADRIISTTNSITVTKVTVLNYLKNPFNSIDSLQDLSSTLKAKNGIYYRILNYLANLPTYDYTLFPISSKLKGTKALKQFEEVALLLNKMNLKYNLPYFSSQLLELGEVYFYELEDSKGIVYKQIPNKFCRLSSVENGVFRYEINANSLTDKLLLVMPKEFTAIKEKFKNGTYKNDEEKKGWYEVSKKGFAFTLNPNKTRNIPPFSSLFPDLIDLEEIKTSQVSDTKNDNVKIVHSKVPIGEDGLPVMDLDVVMEFNRKIQDKLPQGYVSIANPFETQTINIKNNLSKEKDLVDIVTRMVYENAGISDMLFNNDKASSEALKKSIETDSDIMFNVFLPMYENFINYKIKDTYEGWQCKILRVSYFNRSEVFSDNVALLNLGGSRLEVLAILGFEPIRINQLRFEQETLKIDDFMIPPQSTYTQSGKTQGDKGGRPSISSGEVEPTDNGEKSLEQR